VCILDEPTQREQQQKSTNTTTTNTIEETASITTTTIEYALESKRQAHRGQSIEAMHSTTRRAFDNTPTSKGEKRKSPPLFTNYPTREIVAAAAAYDRCCP